MTDTGLRYADVLAWQARCQVLEGQLQRIQIELVEVCNQPLKQRLELAAA
jgi:hypothetical protein